MRKIVLTLAAIAAVGIALPVASNSASAETVVIKQNRGHHYGWRHRDRDRVVVRHQREHRMVVREGHRHHGVTTGVEVR
jgi:Ni/Co efflux regulator RcnB